jgi:hypothetical protein
MNVGDMICVRWRENIWGKSGYVPGNFIAGCICPDDVGMIVEIRQLSMSMRTDRLEDACIVTSSAYGWIIVSKIALM